MKNGIIYLFCIIGAIRVSILGSAFPFFANTDELMHCDLVIKYHKGVLPKKIDSLSEPTCRYIAGCGSNEYVVPLSNPNEQYRPLYKSYLLNGEEYQKYIGLKNWWSTIPNYESCSFPLYYAVSAVWYKVPIIIGLFYENTIYMLYWMRALNIIIIICLILLTNEISKKIFPKQSYYAICLPLIISTWPQDTFYTIQNDVLSPLLFGICFLKLLVFYDSVKVTSSMALQTGLSLAATTLNKVSNLPVLVVVVLIVSYKLWTSRKSAYFKSRLSASLVFYICVLSTITIWFIRNYFVVGDITASSGKMVQLHWTIKPISEWFRAKIFTLDGFSYFWTETIKSFWRGELFWWGERVKSDTMDRLYCFVSTLFLIVTLVYVLLYKTSVSKTALNFALIIFFAYIAYFMILSAAIDFHDCAYPSSGQPFFVSGRLISGATLPFALIFLFGFDRLFSIYSNRFKIISIVLYCVAITTVEIYLHIPVFSSKANLFAFI